MNKLRVWKFKLYVCCNINIIAKVATFLALSSLVSAVTVLNSKTKPCKDRLNFVLKFDMSKVLLWLTEDEVETLTYFRMCLSKAVHVLQLKPIQLVWCGVV